MCIIFIKNKGLELPSKKTIETMCSNNPHGSGFCYAEKGQVIIKKGYMDFDSFYKALTEIPNIKDINLIGHCRITTHGSTSQGNCHPFPLSNSIKDLKSHEIKTKVGIIHNGVIRGVEVDKKHDLSDTMSYIKNVLYSKYEADKHFMDKLKVRKQIQKEINSKMVIMKSNGEYFTIGDFNKDEDGYIYSNYSYVPYDYESLYNEEESIFNQDWLQLEYDDFILLGGQRVYGDEAELYLLSNGEVYMDDGDFIKVANYAFDKSGSIINFKDRILLELEEIF